MEDGRGDWGDLRNNHHHHHHNNNNIQPITWWELWGNHGNGYIINSIINSIILSFCDVSALCGWHFSASPQVCSKKCFRQLREYGFRLRTPKSSCPHFWIQLSINPKVFNLKLFNTNYLPSAIACFEDILVCAIPVFRVPLVLCHCCASYLYSSEYYSILLWRDFVQFGWLLCEWRSNVWCGDFCVDFYCFLVLFFLLVLWCTCRVSE
jgi:hypothetical protein